MRLELDKPSKKQVEFMRDAHKYLAFGGARGGGKSHAVKLDAIVKCLTYPGIKIMIIRKTYPELQENHIKPLCEWLHCYAPDRKERAASYNDQKKTMVFPNGSQILFRYCDNDKDAERFQGTECDVLYVDEATQQSEERMKKLTACVRGVNDFPKQVRYTCNPGGEGHGWVKRLFVDRRFEEGETPEDYGFIQSSVYDNKALMSTNPDYIRQLEALPPKIRDAWLYGNWDIYEGQFFEDFRLEPDVMAAHEHGCDMDKDELRAEHRWVHVIEPFDVSAGERRGWNILRSFDWGYNKPFSCAWWAIDYDGTMYRILELYGCTKTPNEGVKWTKDQVFSEIARIEHEHPWLKGRRIDGVADPAIFASDGGESIAEAGIKYGVYFVPGDNARIPGWMQCHYRLQFDEHGYPRLYVFDNCKAFIRTIPLLLYDEHKPEDLDTDLEDHCLTGDTLVLTDAGYREIREIVGTEGLVYSSDGELHRYHDVRMTRRSADVYAVEMEDGTTIYATDDHRFMTPSGEWIHVRDLAAGDDLKNARVKSIRYAGKADVFNMEVDETHDFIVQGGIVSHNCADEWRYAMMSRPIAPRKPIEKQIIPNDPLDMFKNRRR